MHGGKGCRANGPVRLKAVRALEHQDCCSGCGPEITVCDQRVSHAPQGMLELFDIIAMRAQSQDRRGMTTGRRTGETCMAGECRCNLAVVAIGPVVRSVIGPREACPIMLFET